MLQRLRHLSHNRQIDLSKPIQVFQVDQVYFIRDGHHRVAVALSRGQETIQALVTQVTVRAPITAELDHDEVLRRAQLSHFLQETNLDGHAPDSDFSRLPPELYAVLRDHIEVHRYYLGSDYGRDFSVEESAASWHDLIYRPLLEVLLQQGVMQEFPRRSDPELYLWITYHREQLRCRGEYRGDAAVARALVQRFSERPLVGLFKRAQRIWRAAWAAAPASRTQAARLSAGTDAQAARSLLYWLRTSLAACAAPAHSNNAAGSRAVNRCNAMG